MIRSFFKWMWVILLFASVTTAWAKIERINGPKCNNRAVVVQGTSSDFVIQGEWVDHAMDNSSVSGTGVSISITERRNGFQNNGLPSVRFRITANNNAATGNRTVTLRYPLGQDTFTLRVLQRANVTSESLPTFTQPFQNNVDVGLSGVGLSNVTQVSAVIKRDSFTPLLDAGGQDASGVTVSAQVNPQTNNNSRADVRLNFSQRLTRATVEITLTSINSCSGLRGAPVRHTVTLTAPTGGPNYVKDHLFDRNNRSYRLGDVVTVTVRLDRPVPNPILSQVKNRNKIVAKRITGKLQPAGETVYWTVIPSNSVKQAGASATPYDANARNNRITIPPGQQTAVITFQVDRCTAAGERNTVKFVTWKPDPNDDSFPNRKETSFTINCQQ